jgi:rhodanese-related sulfurtransferase
MQPRPRGSCSDMVKDINPREFMERRAAGVDMTLLDVREDWEVEKAPAPTQFVHIPMGELSARLAELDPRREIVVLCRSGGRSMQVAQYLDRQQFSAVSNVTGGILAWARDLDPTIPTY